MKQRPYRHTSAELIASHAGRIMAEVHRVQNATAAQGDGWKLGEAHGAFVQAIDVLIANAREQKPPRRKHRRS